MGIGCFLTIIATFMQTFSPRGQLGVFIAGRVLIGIGQGIALSKYQIPLTVEEADELC
jgi:glucose-6-phosphate-specific signal transduction histidine kinase